MSAISLFWAVRVVIDELFEFEKEDCIWFRWQRRLLASLLSRYGILFQDFQTFESVLRGPFKKRRLTIQHLLPGPTIQVINELGSWVINLLRNTNKFGEWLRRGRSVESRLSVSGFFVLFLPSGPLIPDDSKGRPYKFLSSLPALPALLFASVWYCEFHCLWNEIIIECNYGSLIWFLVTQSSTKIKPLISSSYFPSYSWKLATLRIGRNIDTDSQFWSECKNLKSAIVDKSGKTKVIKVNKIKNWYYVGYIVWYELGSSNLM